MSIAFGDNTLQNSGIARFLTIIFFPKCYIPEDILLDRGLPEKLHFYDGFKEDIYLAG